MSADVATKTGVANAALVKIGHPATLADVDTDTSAAALAIRHHWPIVRDALLARKHWNFATAIHKPGATVATLPGRLSKVFPLPTDVIVIRDVEGLAEDDWERQSPDITDASGVTTVVDALVTNADAPVVVYTSRVLLPKHWSPGFTDTFIELLAAAIAPSIARNRSTEIDRKVDARDKGMDAARIDAQERAPRRVPTDTTWITARRRGR